MLRPFLSVPTISNGVSQGTCIFTLPSATLLYPGHDYHGHTVTSVGEEQRCNSRLAHGVALESFLGVMKHLKLAAPARIAVAVPANLESGLAR